MRKKLKLANEAKKELRAKIAELRALVKLRAKQAFGKKSERKRTSRKENKNKQPRKGRPHRDFSNLEIKEEINDLLEEQKCCSRCGKPRCKLPANISDTIEIEVKAHIRRIQSPQYAKTCKCPDREKYLSGHPHIIK